MKRSAMRLLASGTVVMGRALADRARYIACCARSLRFTSRSGYLRPPEPRLRASPSSASCDSWDSLLATPLSGWQIVRGKTLGAIWGLRGFGGILSLFWIVGLAAGAVHPLGLSLALSIVAVLTWFVLALGTHASLTGKTTARALAATIAILIGLNFGYLGVLAPIVMVWGSADQLHYPFVACTPWTASSSLLSYAQVAQLAEFLRDFSRPSEIDWRYVGYVGLVLLAYVLGALLLTWRSVRRFDLVVNRPRRPSP